MDYVFCPACGAQNPNGARFCRECRTRLDSAGRADLREDREPDFRPTTTSASPPPGLDLTGLAVWLGLLGIPGVVIGAILIRRQGKARGRPLAAVVLGSAVTLLIVGAAVGLFSRPDPLRRRLTPERVPGFAANLTARLDVLQARAENMRARLGPGADQELAPFYAYVGEIWALVKEMDAAETDAELDSLRDIVLEDLDSARVELGMR